MESPIILDQAQQVKAYLYRKKRENGNERLRLAKAMQWYFFYAAMLTTGIFLIHNYPNVLDIFSSIESYVIVIAFYVLMYGMVFVAYMTTPWPYPLQFDKAAAIKAMNWSPQLCWVERLMTIIYYTFYVMSDMPTYIGKDHWGAIILVVLQLPHIFTSFLGFPIRLSLQILCIVLRFLGLVLSICHLHLSFIFFNSMQTLGISGVLGALPFALLVGMYFNGRVDKRPAFFVYGKKRRDFAIMGVAGLSFFLWEGLLCFMVFYYNTPAYSFPQYFWRPVSHPFESLVDFLEVCVIACMAVLSIPALYHGLLKISEAYPQQVYVEQSESTRLIDITLPQTAPRNFMDHIALVIACHKSKDNIIKTLHAAHHYAHFPKQNIYIAHNAGTPEPIDETGPTVWAEEEWRDVHYIYIPVGNKSIAINYVVENYVKPAGIPLMVMIDDDVLFPPDIDMKGGYEQIMNDEKVKAVAFTIRGIEDSNFWQKFQHLEYMQAGLLKMFQGNFGTVMTCHGAIALWDVQACIDVFALHNTEFHGEDLQMGLILRRMNKNLRIEANAVGPVATTSPKSLLYESDANEKSLFSQRVFSWDMAAHHFFIDFISLTFVNWEKCGLILKPFLVIELWTMLQDWLRFLFLTSIFQQNPLNAISLIGVLIILQMIVVLIFDKLVLSHRQELQSPTLICMLYPIYNVITVLFRFVGLLYNTLYYTPWNPPRILIKDRKRLGMIPPKVTEPLGDSAEREAYWKTVWKLETYTKAQQPPPALQLDGALAEAVASVAQAVLDHQQGQGQGAAPQPDSVIVEIDGATPGEPDEDEKKEEKKENKSKLDEEIKLDEEPNSEIIKKQEDYESIADPDETLEKSASAVFGKIEDSTTTFNKFVQPSPELTPRGKNRRVRWDDTESCDSFIDALKLDATFNKRSIRVST